MKHHVTIVVGLSALAWLAAGTAAIAQEQGKPAVQAQAEQRSDKEVAAQYGSEAAELRAKARSHRSLASQYRARAGGKIDYGQIAGHCDKLAKFYEDAAKEAEAIASGLSKSP